MIIYLDESKKIAKGDFIYGGFITTHNAGYITNFIEYNKNEFGIEGHLELKSTNKFGKKFSDKIIDIEYYKKLNIETFGFHYKNYNVDSFDNYTKALINTIDKIYPILKDYKYSIKIIPDRTSFKDFKKSEKKLENLINHTFKFKKKLVLKFENSSTTAPLQLADLVVGKYKEFYLFDDISLLDEFVNMNKVDTLDFIKGDYTKI